MPSNTKVTLLATVALLSSMALPALAAPFDADVYERDLTITGNEELVEREPFFGLVKAGLGILGSLTGGRRKKRDLEEIDELAMRELLEELSVQMRGLNDALEFDAREFDEELEMREFDDVEELEMRNFDELEFEAREIDADMFDLAERDFEFESLDAREYEYLEEMD
ncbi:hypothetical protein BKA70DRAFT_56149 [Coprinopsis sp. MPI-PUGE-AT-0042]|nr:hypothetical protein BKA70DRAFT_56149 [Coprinopsis sp. MPI-PUGE-AT-0042]